MAIGNAGGRPRKPTALKKLKGTLQPCRTNKLEPNPEVQIPEMPETLKGTDAGSWETLGKKLKAMGVITDLDQMAFELLCGVYAEYVALRSALWVEDVSRPGNYIYEPMYEVSVTNKDGSTNEYMKTRPEVAILSDAWRRLDKMLSNFGLTPSARSKVTMTDGGTKNQTPYDDLTKSWPR